MSEEPVIGGERTEERAEPVIGAPPPEADAGEAGQAGLAELLREALLAAHDELAPEDLAGETAAAVRERFLAARTAREAPGTPVPAGAPGRFAPAPAGAFEKIREGLARLGG